MQNSDFVFNLILVKNLDFNLDLKNRYSTSFCSFVQFFGFYHFYS